MIYLRPSRRIKNTESAGNIVISESLLDEHLSHIAYFSGDKRPFALRIEASNGVVLDEHSTTATELSVRIYTREGVDVTEFIGSLKPSWQIGSEEVEKGLSYTVQASILKNWHTKIIVTTTAARILDAMGKLQSKSPEELRLLERLTIDASIEVRRDFVLLQRIPTAELIRDTLKLDREFIAATTGKQGDKGDPGKDGKSVTLGEVTATLKKDTEFIRAVTGPQGVQGPRGIQGPQGAKGADGKQGDKGEPGAAGAPGKDADPVRPNLLKGFMCVEKKTLSAIGTANTHTKLGVKEYLMRDRRYILSADVELLEGSSNSISIGLLLSSGTFLTEVKTPLNSTKTRASLYINLNNIDPNDIIDILGYAGERGKTRGNLARYYNIKLEEINSDTDKASAYLPHVDDLATSAANKITQESIYLSRIQDGMARYDDFNQVRKIVEGHQVNWATLDDNYLRPIRKLQDDLRVKQNESEQRLGDVEQDIIKFAYRAVGTSSSEWSDYTNN